MAKIPSILYGTAWKKERTADLVFDALCAGFRGIDTACQPLHYDEALTGEGIRRWCEEKGGKRADLFIQTKFSPLNAQRCQELPYDASAAPETQVKQSFNVSLKNLQTYTIDSYILHGPQENTGPLTPYDWEAWAAFGKLQKAGLVRYLGISNVSAEQLKDLLTNERAAGVTPNFVQNRCYASRQWDHAVREICRAHDILYQGFSLLTANLDVVESPGVASLSSRYGLTKEQLILKFASEIGMQPLTGTTNKVNMKLDLAAVSDDIKRLTPQELLQVESLQLI